MTKFHAEECPFGTFFRILKVVNVKHLRLENTFPAVDRRCPLR